MKFLTRDRDFGRLAFRDESGAGILYLRILPSNLDAIYTELLRVLERHTEAELQKAFVVIESGRHRFRRNP